MHLQELVALLPDDASVQRHFDQPGPGQKVPPFVIARRVTSSEFGALLDLIATREEPPIYLKDLDLDADGTLQVSLMQPIAIPEMASIWHDCVSEAIVAHMREGLCQAGLSPDALVPFGGARYPSAICGVRMATGVQIGRKPNGNRFAGIGRKAIVIVIRERFWWRSHSARILLI